MTDTEPTPDDVQQAQADVQSFVTSQQMQALHGALVQARAEVVMLRRQLAERDAADEQPADD